MSKAPILETVSVTAGGGIFNSGGPRPSVDGKFTFYDEESLGGKTFVAFHTTGWQSETQDGKCDVTE